MGLVPLTHEAIVPYLVAVSLLARMCNTDIFIIPATSHKRYASTLLHKGLHLTNRLHVAVCLFSNRSQSDNIKLW